MLTPHQSKALNYKSHISLTANAGSGKTFVLSKRYLEIALNENVPLRNIAAITFTDKAAGELYKKIAKEIDDRINSANNKLLVERLENIRQQLVSANISTIHSFCMDILREHPVEAEIDANFSPIDEIFADEMIELSVEEVIKSALENHIDEEKIKYLIRFFSSRYILSREIKSSIKHRRNLIYLSGKIYTKPAEEIAADFQKTFLGTAEEILKKSLDDFIQAASKLNMAVMNDSPKNPTAVEISRLISKIKSAEHIEKMLEILNLLRSKMTIKTGTIAVKGYLSREAGNSFINERLLVEEFLGKLNYFKNPENHQNIEIELARFGKELLYVFDKVLRLYSEKKRESGYLDYEDILLFTQNILRHESVRKALAEKFKYIMVDEYQDTNELQYNIFLPILDYLRKGNLFVVGDEKQSIYMFRDAELEIFNKTKQEINQSAGNESQLSLPDSFRMAPNLCLFINTLFKNLFENPNPKFNEVEHSEIVCAREDNVKGEIEILLADTDSEEEDISEEDLVTARILKLVHKQNDQPKIRWGDVAVLCRKRKSFIEIEKSFIKKDIPYSIIGGKGFYQRQSIYDISNYFSFLLNQEDDTALVGILRSPFFAISDTEIFQISQLDKTGFWQKLQSYSSANPRISLVVNRLVENISLVNKIEISSVLRKILLESGYIALIHTKSNAEQEKANIDKLLNLTINFFSEGFRTLYDYVNFLHEAIEELEDESQAVISDELNSVKIMTIHQAKGLEFPYIFLFNCGETTQRTYVKSKSIQVNKEFGILAKVPLNENYFTEYLPAPIVQLSNYINEKKNIAEIKRLLYVAMTRAKNGLFISASLKSFLSPKYDSFIGLIQKGFAISADAQELKLKSSLKLLSNKSGEFIGKVSELEIHVPVCTRVEAVQYNEATAKNVNEINAFLTDNIKDKTQGEIISATKLSIFKQCELKYNLIYEMGFSNLMAENLSWIKNNPFSSSGEQYDFTVREEIQTSSDDFIEKTSSAIQTARLKGIVIHKLVKEEIEPSDLNAKATEVLSTMFNEADRLSDDYVNLKKTIVHDLSEFYKSSGFQFLRTFSNYKNEFEIYHAHNDYYLYGIIDKLIQDNDKIIIVDYKTDSITASEVKARAEQYFTQLKFYAYIAAKLFNKFSSIELKLIFIKHPNELSSLQIAEKDLTQIEKEIEKMVERVRLKNPKKNLAHCQYCNFAINNICIVT